MNKIVCKFFCFVMLALLATGCGSGGPPQYKAVGVVTYKGQPVEGATVNFAYDDGNSAVGLTDAAGKFQLISMGGGKRTGATPGKGTLTVFKISGGASQSTPSKMLDPKGKTNSEMDKMKEGLQNAKPPEAAKSVLPQKYMNADTSDLKFEVLPNNNNNFVADLKD